MKLIRTSLVLTLSNGGVCILGDFLVELNKESAIRKAICDNATHTMVGLLGALIMILEKNHHRLPEIERISLIVMTMFASSFIDVDHFLVAKSFKLSRAVAIDRRPFLHYATIPLILLILMIPLYNYFNSPRLNVWLVMIVCAFLTHHTRDATRRGFTFWPFGTTKPLPYIAYIVCIMIIPFILNKWEHLITGHYHYGTLEIQTV
ncbi:transmembrane protein 267 [Contarinia nasturtii]|uniref:transmembrane protein 267 n=1 Tax=Contarinia nasturtii TaxID=265458 RepID=UPI0012D440E8|nr:transmembrane protein 267 [Contarinia nasturtii]